LTTETTAVTTDLQALIHELQPGIQGLVDELGGFPGRLIRPEEATLPSPLSGKSFLRHIDESRLKPNATPSDIEEMCRQAREFGFGYVLANPIYLPLAAALVAGSNVSPVGVVAFPFGASLPEAKAREARQAVLDGAREIDMVLPIGELRAGNYRSVVRDILTVVREVHGDGVRVKVIVEPGYLDLRQLVAGCLAVLESGADFVKDSTGFAPVGATVDNISLMRRIVGGDIGVKAAGGIRTLADARALIEAGATRIGTSSGAKIARELLGEQG
jgi:deoxyribose-phosphate aldolase